MRNIGVFDVYEGKGIAEGHRSLAFHCELFDGERTLSTKQADALRAKVIGALESNGWNVAQGLSRRTYASCCTTDLA